MEGGKPLGEEVDPILFGTRGRREFAEHESVGEDKFLVSLQLVAEFGQGRHKLCGVLTLCFCASYEKFFSQEKVEASGVLRLKGLYELVFQKVERMMRAVSLRR